MSLLSPEELQAIAPYIDADTGKVNLLGLSELRLLGFFDEVGS